MGERVAASGRKEERSGAAAARAGVAGTVVDACVAHRSTQPVRGRRGSGALPLLRLAGSVVAKGHSSRKGDRGDGRGQRSCSRAGGAQWAILDGPHLCFVLRLPPPLCLVASRLLFRPLLTER